MSASEQQLIVAVQKAKRLWHRYGVNSTEFHNALLVVFHLAAEPDPPPLGVSVSEQIEPKEKLA